MQPIDRNFSVYFTFGSQLIVMLKQLEPCYATYCIQL